MAETTYGPLAGDGEVGSVARLIHHAFAGPVDKSEEWLREAGPQHVRVLRAPGGLIVACLLRVPMAQYFGGASVRMMGVAGVAVSPEARGKGFARTMMREFVREMRGEGFPIGGLYASTQPLYRQVGYEQTGCRFQATVPIHRIDVSEHGLDIRPLVADGEAQVRECYRRFAVRFDGMLDRSEYSWARTKKLREVAYSGFGCFDAHGTLRGYVRLAQTRKPETGGHDLAISDLAFLDATAGRRLLTFMADFATMGEDVVFQCGPIHPLLTMIGARHYRVEKRDYWMTRVLDVKAALEARGWPAGVVAGAVIEVTDDLLPENQGIWSIHVADGRARVDRADQATGPVLRANVRGLAAMYSGLYSASQAALAGLVEGDEASLRAADSVFRSTSPWMADFF
ncbi:MAG: GNAT family N-acetyltransferase [Phycisphaeraceae bacterium]|nr:GNAT family N-acetyltransferase [Phycisphaeraceae bacterium]